MNWKKPLSLVLGTALTLSLAAPALAAPEGWTPADGARTAQQPWYAEAQAYVTEKGLMTGTDKGFEPDATVTRGTVFQTLYNMEKPQFATLNLAFPDTEGAWYDAAANWAGTMELAQGDEKGLFNGDRAITRAELVVALHRYAELKGLQLPVVEENASDPVMLENDFYVPQWAVEDFYWAIQTGLIQGVNGENSIEYYPNRTTTRAELATLLMRFDTSKAPYIEQTVSYDSDGRTVPAVVTLPVGNGPFPAVVINHGHGGSKDENVGFIGVARALAEAGIASIRMDFAGCGDSEAPFTDNTLSKMEADSNAGLAFLLDNYLIDENRLGILGYSMGGRLALEIVSKENNPYKAVVLLSAAANPGQECINGALGLDITIDQAKKIAQDKGSYDYTTQYGQELSLSAQWFDDMLVDPLADIANYTGPMLVLHGDKDVVVTDETNKLILAAYPAAQEIIVPDADHGYGFYSDQPEVTAMVEGSITDFFTQNLPAAEEETTAEHNVLVLVPNPNDGSYFEAGANGARALETAFPGTKTEVVAMGTVGVTEGMPTAEQELDAFKGFFLDAAESGKYDLIITGGAECTPAMLLAAKEYPDQKFFSFDLQMVSEELRSGNYTNVYGVTYKNQDLGYLAGYIACQITTSDMEKANADKKIGIILGMDVPGLNDYAGSFCQAAQEQGVTVYVDYVGDFIAEMAPTAAEKAKAMYDDGVDVIWQVAGGAGKGVFTAAAEAGRYALGVDCDQTLTVTDPAEKATIVTSFYADSAAAIHAAFQGVLDGTFPGGTYPTVGLAEGFVGFAHNDQFAAMVPQSIQDSVVKLYETMSAGTTEIFLASADEAAWTQLKADVAP